jgi:hypothetical protein
MIITDASRLSKDLNQIINYSIGFLNGVQAGKTKFLNNVGLGVIEMLKQYIDSSARVNPAMLQHMYEWGQSGSPDARLFDLDYFVNGGGLSVGASFTQSRSIKDGSNVPFYDKARIMEQGIPVVIKPRQAQALAFDVNGETVFTKKEVSVENPGGSEAKGGFEEVFNQFFNRFFTQAFLDASGIKKYLNDPQAFANNFDKAVSGGRALGLRVGYNWISNAEVKL